MAEVINLNSANTDELTTLPGVGPAMAQRIVASRPFAVLEDLLQVTGIGPAMVERLTPLVTVTDEEGQEEQDEVIYLDEVTQTTSGDEYSSSDIDSVDSSTDSDEFDQEIDGFYEDVIPREKAIVPVNEKEIRNEAETKKTNPITMNRLILISTVSSLFAFMLAVLLCLGIIGSINGGLRYASRAQVENLYRQVEMLDIEISTLTQDIDGLRTRLDNIEGLSGRIVELETRMDDLSQEVVDLTGNFDLLDSRLIEISEIVDGFQSFLEGLGDLLDNLDNQTKEAP